MEKDKIKRERELVEANKTRQMVFSSSDVNNNSGGVVVSEKKNKLKKKKRNKQKRKEDGVSEPLLLQSNEDGPSSKQQIDKYLLERWPVKYFLEEMNGGNSLRMTTTLANEKDRERVYDTIFRMPWRCELLIDVGFFVCLDSFLSLLTIMPIRLLTTSWRLLKTRKLKSVSAADLSDFGCFLMLASGIILLLQTDISLIYHMIRGQGTIKLYVVYNVLEIFDKLCQNFGGDVLHTLFNTADGFANCSSENMRYWLWRFISDEALAITSSIIHSFILLAQAITLSTCIVAHNNALFALLVSNNFSEIKSNVFKRFNKDNIQSLVYFDSVERFHIASFLIFVLAQNILEAEGPWFENFLYNAFVVYICELMIDIIKHSFIAKFNEVKPIVYSEFLEDLCKQVGVIYFYLSFPPATLLMDNIYIYYEQQTDSKHPARESQENPYFCSCGTRFCGDTSAESGLCGAYSVWALCLATCVDSHDVSHADGPQAHDWIGPP